MTAWRNIIVKIQVSRSREIAGEAGGVTDHFIRYTRNCGVRAPTSFSFPCTAIIDLLYGSMTCITETQEPGAALPQNGAKCPS